MEGILMFKIAEVFLIALVLLQAVLAPTASAYALQATPPVDEYRIGPNDLLVITVFEQPELGQTVRVSEDGSVALSLLGKVAVAGLTTFELEKKLKALLEEKWLKVAHVSVFIREHQKVAVLGAVARPGMYEMTGQTTLLQLISLAGGLTPDALKELFIYRVDESGKNKKKITVNVQDLIQEGNQNLDIVLQAKDEVVVPIDQIITVYVYGEVKIPGALQVKMSKKITLLQAIAQAGGTTEWASKTGLTINRRDVKTGRETKMRVNLKDIIGGKSPDIALQEGDVVIVP